MASLGNPRNLNFAQCGGLGGGCPRLPPSSMPFNWREDPSIADFRVWNRRRIADIICSADIIGRGNTGENAQVIAQLTVEFDNRLFTSAVSKEDYINRETLNERLGYLVAEKYCCNHVQQKATYAVPSVLPTFSAQPPMEHLKRNTSANSLESLTDSMIAPGTPHTFGSADYFRGPQLSPDAMFSLNGSQGNDFTWGSQKSPQMISSLSHQVTSSMPFLVDGIPSIKRVDNNLAFSGSVPLCEYEESFDRYCKSQHFNQAVNDPVTSANQRPSYMHITSPLDGNPILNNVSNGLFFNGPSSGKRRICQLFAQENNTSVAEPDFLGTSELMPTSDAHQHSVKNENIRIMSCYIKFKDAPKTSCLGQRPFLQHVHTKRCKDACNCKRLKLILDHIDCCASPQCRICRPALILLGDPQRIDTSFGSFASSVSDLFSTPSKVRKLNSFSSNEVPFSRSHSASHEVTPTLQQCSGSHLFSNSSDTRLNMEIEAQKQLSPSINETKIDLVGCEQKFSSDNASPMFGKLVDCKQSDTDPTLNSEDKDKALETLSSPSKCVGNVSEHQCTLQTNNDGLRSDSEGTNLNITVQPLKNISSVGTLSEVKRLKMQGVSLTDFFTPEDIKQHMWSLKQSINQTVPVQEIGSAMNNSISENFCQLCSLDKLWFSPMPIFCSACASRIKCKGAYYCTLDENGGQIYFCSACYNKSRGADKSKMEMKKNDVVTEESWVQCDKCEGWQHQICALFNEKRNFGGKAEYICPKCHLAELEAGDCKPLPCTSCFGASNLSRTKLSDHLEQRLFERLEKDREHRAKADGKDLDKVLGASDLTIRVVSSVDKVLKVKQQFQDIFPDKSYPAEFPYRSKVILLFQKIEGVDVCLFGMYVQEFGSQCSRPNQRCIYISYLDSVKYFRPETKSAAGEALRTFVYHEILIGYLEYCKKRGFSTCYIWACPPVKGEDYVLYCHPETQKTPKSDKLRQWYLSMLRKATKEKIVMNSSNIYEQFFVPNERCNIKVTAARLPYFDGDYWSSVADSMIEKIEKECGGNLQKKVMKMTRRSLKAMGHTGPTVTEGGAKDLLLMHELRQKLAPKKDDFIIVYLQFICTHCHEVIASGKRWYCSQCKNFQLCEGCHNEDKNPEGTHILSSGQKHALSQEVVDSVPIDTEDNDAIMNNCFLENRHALLSFCQGNHYQFDTLRRAKHSSMMILYHLHHPLGPTTGITCSLCLKDVVVDQQWKCNLCPEFIVCDACYQRNGVGCHTHNLTQNLAPANVELTTERDKRVKEMLDVLLHASKCCSVSTSPCNYPNCLLLKKLFSHARICTTRVHGGCHHCKKVWCMLTLHSQQCQDWDCGVPRCRDLKKDAAEHNVTGPPNSTPEATQ